MNLKEIIKNFNKGIIVWFWISVTFWIFWVSYALLSDLKVNSWETLTATDWNAMVDAAVPTGAVIAFYWNTCPEWWNIADWSWDEKMTDWTNWSLDLRGEFIRWLDNGKGVDTDRILATSQWDTIRNITWNFWNIIYQLGSLWGSANGVFLWQSWLYWVSQAPSDISLTQANNDGISFDASRQVPTASENRPRNVALLYCVKN